MTDLSAELPYYHIYLLTIWQAESGLTDRFRYELYAYRVPEAVATGESGPEFSMQNTR